jgi:hypothetical protein
VVEGEVGEGNILLEFRAAGHPLGQALPDHEIVVSMPEQIHEEWRRPGSRLCRLVHIWPTSSGMWK